MADIATLGIRIENGDVLKASNALDGLTVAGGKSEAATQRLTRRMALLEIEARSMDAAQRAAAVGIDYTTRAMALEQIKALEMDAAMHKAAAESRALADAQRKTATAVDYTTRSMAQAQTEALKMDAAMGKSESRVLSMAKAWIAASAVLAAGAFLTKLIKESIDAQNATAQLEAAIQSTGGAAGRSVAQLEEYASAMQRTTTYSDDAIKGAQSVLLTFTQIQGVQFDNATSAVADLATRMGGDLSAAAVQVGKALNDPIKGITALQRVGVSFSASQKDVIKNLAETGRLAEAQTLILNELRTEFGGSATAARQTLGGALQGLRNDFGDLFEATNGETAALVDFVNATGGAIRVIGEYRETVKSAGEAIVVAGAGVLAFKAAMALNTIAVAGGGAAIAAALLPVTALAAGFGLLTLAVQNGREEMRQLQDEADEATKNTPAHLAYLKALGIAHSQKGGAGQLVKPAGAPGTTDEAAKSAASIAQQQLEVDKIRALTAAYGESDTALARINIEYDRRIEHAKNAVGHTAAETAALNALTDAKARALLQDIERKEAARANAEFQSRLITIGTALSAKAIEEAEATKKLIIVRKELTDGVYRAAGAQIELTASIKDQTAAIQAGVVAQQARIEANAKGVNTVPEYVTASVKYADEMQAIWRSGIAKIVTDGTKSFRDFFEDVLQMFTRLMARMEAANKASGALYKGLGIGASAITGAFAGYQIGQQTGSSALGVLGGAASGALAGNAILPGLGAAIGGLAGAAGGLLGASKAQRAAAEQLQESALALRNTVETYVTGSYGNDTASRILAENQRYESLRLALEKQFEAERHDPSDLPAYYVQQEILLAAHERYLKAINGNTSAINSMTQALNVVAGYRYQDTIFGAMTARDANGNVPTRSTTNSSSASSTTAPGSGVLTINVTLPTGEVLGTAVIKDWMRRDALGDQSLRALLS